MSATGVSSSGAGLLSSSSSSSVAPPLTAEEKLVVLNEALERIDHSFVSSTVSNWFHGSLDKTLRLERVIINLLANARTDELNFLVSHVKLGLLFYKVGRQGGRPQTAETGAQ